MPRTQTGQTSGTAPSALPGRPNAARRRSASRRARRRRTPWISARRAPTSGTQAGRLRLPRCGTGARYGLSVSTSVRVERAQRGRGAAPPARPLNVTMPEKLTNAPRSRQRRASSGPPVKQWKIVRGGHALGVEDVERVVPRLAGVDDERQVELGGRVATCAANASRCASRGEWS